MARPSSAYELRPVTTAAYLDFVASRGGASFLQTPAWAAVKNEWRGERVGWYGRDGVLRGVALVLYRQVPVVPRSLAYIPEGPVLPWDEAAQDLDSWLEPLVAHVRRRGAFAVKIGPPVVTRRWRAATIKTAAASDAKRLGDVEPDEVDPRGQRLVGALRARKWTREDGDGAGFGDVQPRYVFQVPLAGRSSEVLWAGLNQQWRRNVRKAEKSGVEVTVGDYAALAEFHPLYVVTAERDGFTPRPLAYFQRMMTALGAEDPSRFRLYLARHEGELLAATIMVRVGDHAWYSYGASASHKRELQPSTAIQWRMISDAHAEGAAVYDLRGISDTLDESDPLFGLIRFKLGTGGEAVEYVGEWDRILRPVWARAVEAYLRRGRGH